MPELCQNPICLARRELLFERKQIPHLRVMGRNIRFLRADLEPFRATFKHEVGDGKTQET